MRVSGLAPLLLTALLLALSACDSLCRAPSHGAPEAVLRADLRALRDVIRQHSQDRGRFPRSFNELIERGYLRKVPVDPLTRRDDTWVPVFRRTLSGWVIVDVHSSAEGSARDGTRYRDW